MSMEKKVCEHCKTQFNVELEDFVFYKKFDVPTPKMCPLCRAQRRLTFKNERSYYKRACDRCQKEVVSMYSPNKPYTVCCYDCWFSDDWDALQYGREYDPKRPFLEQFEELWKQVPKVALIYVRSVNSEYVNISADNKDCYMIVESSNNERCTHCYWIQQCRDCVDTSFAHQTELSYESDDCYNSYRLQYSKGCHGSRESYFLLDCRDCSNCIGCVNLRSKQYHIFNKPHSKEEYESFVKEARLDTYSGVEAMRNKFREFVLAQPLKYAEIVNAPGCTGNYISDAKNCQFCFHSYEAEDCRYGVHVWRNAKDCMDVDTSGRNSEMMYNSINTGIDTYRYISSAVSWSSTFLWYSYYCFNSNNCVGSVGLRKKNYCILNKQYEKAEFEEVKNAIIDQMQKRGEYGEFFPARFSTFGYNESAAQEQFPLTKEEALKQGFKWEDHPRGTFGKETISWDKIPDSIKDLRTLDPSKEIFVCTSCSKNYRIIPEELRFYKKYEIPLPRLCPDCRHARRFKARGQNRLFGKQCDCAGLISRSARYKNLTGHFHKDEQCPNRFQTSYADDYVGIVYCGQCYNAEIA